MQRISIVFFFTIIGFSITYVQGQVSDTYARNLYKVNDTLYVIKPDPKGIGGGVLMRGYSLNSKNLHSLPGIEEFPTQFYNDFRWDMGLDFLVLMTYSKRGVEIGSKMEDVRFLRHQELLNPVEFIEAHQKIRKAVEGMPKKTSFAEKLKRTIHMTYDVNQKHIVSKNPKGIANLFDNTLTAGTYYNYSYDLILKKNNELLNPVQYEDSLYLYTYTNKLWTSPTYAGIEKLPKGTDSWIQNPTLLCPFKGKFRAFELANSVYFLADSDTSIYRLEGDHIKRIARITKPENSKLLFLIDRDSNDDLYLMNATQIEFIEERYDFIKLLKPESPLYTAIKKLIE